MNPDHESITWLLGGALGPTLRIAELIAAWTVASLIVGLWAAILIHVRRNTLSKRRALAALKAAGVETVTFSREELG